MQIHSNGSESLAMVELNKRVQLMSHGRRGGWEQGWAEYLKILLTQVHVEWKIYEKISNKKCF